MCAAIILISIIKKKQTMCRRTLKGITTRVNRNLFNDLIFHLVG